MKTRNEKKASRRAPPSLSNQRLSLFEFFFQQKPKQYLLRVFLSLLDISLIHKPDTDFCWSTENNVSACKPVAPGFGFAECMGKHSVLTSPWENEGKRADSHIYSFVFYPHSSSIFILSLWGSLELQAFIPRNEQSNSVYIKVTWKLPQWLSSSFLSRITSEEVVISCLVGIWFVYSNFSLVYSNISL